MSDFEWQVIDDESQTVGPTVRETVKPKRRLGRAIAIALLLVGLAVAAVYLELARRAEEARADVKKDVLASHSLVWRAGVQADRELLDMALADSPGWRTAQHQLLERGLLTGRDPFGFVAQANDPEIIEVSLSPDLREAQVVSEQAYTITGSHGLTETIRLRHTFFYQRYEGQPWRLSPPYPEFWDRGRQSTSLGQILTLDYPMRDAEIGHRLARDLYAGLSKLCARLGDVLCQPGTHVRITLSTVPTSLIQMAAPESIHVDTDSREISFDLPSITLFGVPVDDAGYQALFRAYTARMIDLFAGQVANIVPPQVDNFAQRFYPVLNRAKIEEGLRPWPLTSTGDPQSPPIPLPNQDIALYCAESVLHGGDLYRYALATGTWSIELSDRIIASMTPLPRGDGIVLREIPALEIEARSRVIVPPERLILGSNGWLSGTRDVILQQYQPARLILRSDGSLSGRTVAISQPDGRERLILWRNGQERLLLEAPANSVPIDFTGRADPSGRKLVVNLGIDQSRHNYALLDLSSCTHSGCGWDALPGLPVWSPDGRRTLLTTWTDGTLYLGDSSAQSLKEIGGGFSPFWLDNRTYGYTARGRSGPPAEIVTAALTDREARTLLRFDDLVQFSPELGQTMSLFYYAVSSDWLLVRASISARGDETNDLFLFNVRSGDAKRLQLSGGFVDHAFSSDGHRLAVVTTDPDHPAWTLRLYDLRQEQAETFTYDSVYAAEAPRFTWSLDGQWLLVLHDGVLHLIAPGHAYQRVIVPESPGCIFAAWVNRSR